MRGAAGADDEAGFLEWIAPRLGLRAVGFRRNQRQVFKRIRRRMESLGLKQLDEYRAFLEATEGEWSVVDACCRVTISRFYRDAWVWDRLRAEVMRSWRGEVTAWSLGCASGEEPYSLAMAWRAESESRHVDARLRIVAVDADAALIERARRGVYGSSSLRELPDTLAAAGVTPDGEFARVREEIRDAVDWRVMDLRRELPVGDVNFALCRNTVFTYVAKELQRDFVARVMSGIRAGGWIVVGREEDTASRVLSEAGSRVIDRGDGMFAIEAGHPRTRA